MTICALLLALLALLALALVRSAPNLQAAPPPGCPLAALRPLARPPMAAPLAPVLLAPSLPSLAPVSPSALLGVPAPGPGLPGALLLAPGPGCPALPLALALVRLLAPLLAASWRPSLGAPWQGSAPLLGPPSALPKSGPIGSLGGPKRNDGAPPIQGFLPSLGAPWRPVWVRPGCCPWPGPWASLTRPPGPSQGPPRGLPRPLLARPPAPRFPRFCPPPPLPWERQGGFYPRNRPSLLTSKGVCTRFWGIFLHSFHGFSLSCCLEDSCAPSTVRL